MNISANGRYVDCQNSVVVTAPMEKERAAPAAQVHFITHNRPRLRPTERPRSPITVSDFETGEALELRLVPALKYLDLRNPSAGSTVEHQHNNGESMTASDPFAAILALGVVDAPEMKRPEATHSGMASTTSDPATLAQLSSLREKQRIGLEKLRSCELQRELERRAALSAEPLPSRRQGMERVFADERIAAAKAMDALRLQHEVELLQHARKLGALPLPAV